MNLLFLLTYYLLIILLRRIGNRKDLGDCNFHLTQMKCPLYSYSLVTIFFKNTTTAVVGPRMSAKEFPQSQESCALLLIKIPENDL